MEIRLSDSFSYSRLIRFTLPSIAMMIVTSIYGVVDGLFVSNVVGSDAFAAVNLILPFVMIFGAAGFMFGTGGSALVAKTLGEGDNDKANQIFSMLVAVIIAIGIVSAIVGIVIIRPIAVLIGADETLIEFCVTYGRIMFLALPAFMLQYAFQPFMVAAEKPKMGLVISIAAGLTNVVFDFLLIYVLDLGVPGAAAASGMSQVVGGVVPLICFAGKKNKSLLRLTKFKFNGRALIRSALNGSSEMMTNLSMSLVNMLFNLQLMKFAGANGVSAFGIIMYASFIFAGVFMGYSVGCAPIISYHYGAQNRDELKSLFRKSLVIVLCSAVVMTAAAEVLSMPLTKVFVGYDVELTLFSCHAFRVFSTAFLLMGFNIFASAFFTALNNGILSALISFLRSLAFQVAMVLLLPLIFGINGIWMAITAAEILTLVVTVIILLLNRKKYGYA